MLDKICIVLAKVPRLNTCETILIWISMLIEIKNTFPGIYLLRRIKWKADSLVFLWSSINLSRKTTKKGLLIDGGFTNAEIENRFQIIS